MRRTASPEETLDLIYGAAVQPSLWVDVMQRLMSMIGGEGGVMMRTDIVDGKGAAKIANGDTSTVDLYFAHYSSINPFQLVPDPSSYIAGWQPRVLLDEDWMPRESFERSEYYNDFLRPLSVEWGLAIRLGLRGLDLATISIGRGFRYGRFEAPEVAAMERLHPHLIRAYALSERFQSLHGFKTGLAEALDDHPSAMFLVHEDARILHANGAAERLLTSGDALVSLAGRLCAADTASVQPLANLIARAGSNDWEQRSAGSLSVQVKGRRLSLKVTAAPLRLEDVSVFARGPAVLVRVADPLGGSAPVGVKLAELFTLTAAEARLAEALYDGLTLRDASIRHGISINTARAQLSSVFAKTQTHRQADLVRLMAAHDGMKSGGPSPR
ncbi:helix-turn-helix transcriptional regulator [Caulobacter sp. S45]|uniref:helix-turn-helix transcriptional regulator n=1 Tax=Caulobacter sp. S45 TaxID=1641861 RepID=UPI0015760EE5|nr:hypothetical protein [Caulobacter sp. S45]